MKEFFTNQTMFRLLLASFVLLNTFTLQAQDLCAPVGWATQNGGTTGGGNATPTVVSTYAELKSAVTSSTVKVVHVKGKITIPAGGRITIQDVSNKTIIGLPGSELISNDMTKDGSGIFYIKRCKNFIMRNLKLTGPGAYDTDGYDNLCIDDCTNFWVDHCEFHDGMDGNFDIKNKSDFISVTWCTFSYEKAPKKGGSGGSDDHRYSNLIGSSDGATGDAGKLNVTFQYCWWGEGCKERMPRIRFGKVHLANNLFDSKVANNCIRAGYKADILAEGNYFDNQKLPIDLFKGDYTAVKGINNHGAANVSKGTVFKPPYSITIASAASIVAPIKSCAGAKLSAPTGCSSCGETVVVPGNNPPTVSFDTPANNQQYSSAPATVAISVNASDIDGSIAKVEIYNGSNWLTTLTSTPYSYNWPSVGAGNYTLKAIATDNKGASTTTTIHVNISSGTSTGQPATLTKRGSGSSTQTVNIGDEIKPFYYEWTNANNVSVTGMPTGIQVTINNTESRVDISGSATEQGEFSYTITTIGGNPENSKSGKITVNETITGLTKLSEQKVICSPNPFNDYFEIRTKGEFTYEIASLNGVVVESGKGNESLKTGNNLSKGLYIIRVINSEGVSLIKVQKP
jgi:pectate lyase